MRGLACLAVCCVLVGCDYGFGYPEFEIEGSSISIAYDSSRGTLLQPDDVGYVNSGLMGLGLSGETTINPTGYDLLTYLRAENELVYVSTHGSGGGFSFPGGIVRPHNMSMYNASDEEVMEEELVYGMRFLVLASCHSGKASWEDAIRNSDVLEGVFAYTDITFDLIDNEIARAYPECLGSYGLPISELTPWDHHECWKEVNLNSERTLPSAWVSFLKGPDGEIVKISPAGIEIL